MQGKETSEGKKTLDDLLEEACKSFGVFIFTSGEVYDEMISRPKNNGNKRKYNLSYAQVKQKMARADYLELLDDPEDRRKRIARYKNKVK
jgi:hypothetical protein